MFRANLTCASPALNDTARIAASECFLTPSTRLWGFATFKIRARHASHRLHRDQDSPAACAVGNGRTACSWSELLLAFESSWLSQSQLSMVAAGDVPGATAAEGVPASRTRARAIQGTGRRAPSAGCFESNSHRCMPLAVCFSRLGALLVV